jgi:hypothetical protein
MKKSILSLSLLFGAASIVLGCIFAVLVGVDCLDKAKCFKYETKCKLREAINKRLAD